MNSMKVGTDPVSPAPSSSNGPSPNCATLSNPITSAAKKEAAAFNKKGGNIKRGVGIACHSFGIAEAGDQADNAVEIDPDDTVTVYAAIADPGEGNDSMLTQLAAHVLGCRWTKYASIPVIRIKP